MVQKLAYSVEEMSVELGIGRELAYQMVKEPGFPAIHVGKRILIPKQALETWMMSEAFKTKITEE